jgi:uncharacterized protein (DUF1778 family)
MATLKPRITVSLSDHQYKVVSTIAKLGGGSMSGFISEMLEAALPTLERMAVTFQRVKDAQDAERGRFLESMDAAQTALEPAVNNAVGQFDLFLARLESASAAPGTPRKGRPGKDEAGHQSPPTNRGDTSQRKTSGKPSAARVSGAFSKNRILKKGGGKKP